MASLHATSPLITHIFTGMNGPTQGTLVKFRFGGLLRGPGSLTSTTDSLISHTSSPMHSALVLGTRNKILPDRRRILEVECYPVISLHRLANPLSEMAKAVGYDKCVHIPIPGGANVPTPTLFGEPLKAGGYINDRASWIQARLLKLTLAEGKKWKSFNPEVTFSIEEISRLAKYEQDLIARFFPSTLEPPPSYSHFPRNSGTSRWSRLLDNTIHVEAK